MISFDAAIGQIRATARPLETESAPLSSALGRVLAQPVIAQIDSPRTDVSAMDGYAVRGADLHAFPLRLRLVGESFAGQRWHGRVGAGECARIFTGAPVPIGADRVIMQENVLREGDVAILEQPPGNARHVRPKGGDFTAGEQLLPAGRLLDYRAIVAAAAADLDAVSVVRRPRIIILSTGDELAEPGSAASQPDAIPESVSFGVAALAERWGATVLGRERLADDLASMEKVAAKAILEADVVVVTGGASVGEKDFAKTMFERSGLELIFSKVGMKPGKPIWLGRAGKALVVGLPGNPTSALVTGRLFLAPLLAGLSGRDARTALRWRKTKLAAPLAACGPRESFHRARIAKGAAEILCFQDSSAQKALADADILVRQRANAPAQNVGSEVEVLDF